MFTNIFFLYKYSCETAQQTNISFDELYTIALQDIAIDKKGYDSLCKNSSKHLNVIENESLLENKSCNLKLLEWKLKKLNVTQSKSSTLLEANVKQRLENFRVCF